MAHNAVFVIKTVVGTAVIASLQKAVHLVLVEVDHAHIAVIILVIDVVCAGLAIGCFWIAHIVPFRKQQNVCQMPNIIYYTFIIS